MLQIIKNSLVNNCKLSEPAKIVLGVSGGPDSVCLLDILHKIGCQIVIAHLNHQLRESAHQEALFVKALAEKYQVECMLESVDIAQVASGARKGIEETAREERYRFLFAIAEQNEADAVAVAHQADDDIETILMNFLRGAGLDGMVGMQYRSFSPYHCSIPLVRPMLSIWREEILNYCHMHRLNYSSDESNQDLSYRRNRIRHELIPYLKQYNPNIKEGLMRMSSLMVADKLFLDGAVCEAEREINLANSGQSVQFGLDNFAAQNLSMQRLLIKRILENPIFQHQMINKNSVELIRKFFCNEIKVLSMRIGSEIVVLKENGKGFITDDLSSIWNVDWPLLHKELVIPISVGDHHMSDCWRLKIEKRNRQELQNHIFENSDFYRAYFDGDKLADSFLIRCWIAADRFQPLGMGGKSVKLSDFWINHKIPKRARKTWPLFFSNRHLVWIPGFQPSFQTCVNDETRNVIIVSLTRNGK